SASLFGVSVAFFMSQWWITVLFIFFPSISSRFVQLKAFALVKAKAIISCCIIENVGIGQNLVCAFHKMHLFPLSLHPLRNKVMLRLHPSVADLLNRLYQR